MIIFQIGTQHDLHEKRNELCIKAISPPASLPLKGQPRVTEHTTIKWNISTESKTNNSSYAKWIIGVSIPFLYSFPFSLFLLSNFWFVPLFNLVGSFIQSFLIYYASMPGLESQYNKPNKKSRCRNFSCIIFFLFHWLVHTQRNLKDSETCNVTTNVQAFVFRIRQIHLIWFDLGIVKKCKFDLRIVKNLEL